ncbi:MAG: gluconate 2-dehydrogenase subunit 3 family protein, partial [Myxococcota bacterium]
MTQDTHAALEAVLDCLIPADPARGLPAAGALGLAAYVTERLGDALAALRPGFAALDAAAGERGSECFAALDAGDRAEVLRAQAERDPGFLPPLL